jgi:hypothetical protein
MSNNFSSNQRRLTALIEAIRSYQQADEDGVMVLVSRQACDEAVTEIERLLELNVPQVTMKTKQIVRPMSERKDYAIIDGRWLLAHAIWCNSYGDCHPETQVRDLTDVDEKTGRPRFDLIQHGWMNFEKAHTVIENGLRKGWSPFRISEVMDRISKNKK